MFWESIKVSNVERASLQAGDYQSTPGALLRNTGAAAIPAPSASHLVVEVSFLQDPPLPTAPGGHSHLTDSLCTASCHSSSPTIGMGQECVVFIMDKRSEKIKGQQSRRLSQPDCTWDVAQ